MTLLTSAIEQAQARIPIDLQIKGAHVFFAAKRKLIGPHTSLTFVESPIPDVAALALKDIDVSNPFMAPTNRQSYFKRLRDEEPVHYLANSPFGPFWSITRYEDILLSTKP